MRAIQSVHPIKLIVKNFDISLIFIKDNRNTKNSHLHPSIFLFIFFFSFFSPIFQRNTIQTRSSECACIFRNKRDRFVKILSRVWLDSHPSIWNEIYQHFVFKYRSNSVPPPFFFLHFYPLLLLHHLVLLMNSF